MIRRIGSRPLLLALLFLTAVGGCTGERAPMDPLDEARGKIIPGGGLTLSEQYLVYAVDTAMAAQVVDQEGGVVVTTLDDIDVLLVLGDETLESRVQQRAVSDLIIEPSIQTNLVQDIELLMAFFESFDGSSDYGNSNGLEGLDLDTVHTAGTGLYQKIALLDTPVDFSHPLLSGKLQSVQVQGLRPPGLVLDPNPENPEAYGHGTHVAGLISMVAPGAKVFPMAVLAENGIGSTVEVALALQKVYEMRHTPGEPSISLVNMSLSFERESRVVREAVRILIADGVTMVAGAGNTGVESGGAVVYPAAYPDVVAVGAAHADTLLIAGFSATDSRVDVGTPGVDLVSAYPGGEMWAASGTSMACGLMTGALAVLQGPVQTQADVSDPVGRLLATSLPVEPAGSWSNGLIAITHALQIFSVPGN